MTDNHPAATALQRELGSCVHLPGDPGYDATRVPWNVAFEQRPAAVAVPRSTRQVAEIVRRAGELGLRVAPQSTGHNPGPLVAQGLQETVIVRTDALNLVIADPKRHTVRAEGGAIWEPAVVAAGAHGHAVLHGSSPDVGIAGYSLGGGIGWLARKYGLATNSLTAVEVVTADGTVLRATAAENAELFWALRGGGGNLGVVTALEFRSYDVPTTYSGFMLWGVEHTEKVLREWAAWAPEAPDDITTAFRVLRLPSLPDVPDFLAGREVVMINGAFVGSDEAGMAELAPLRGLRPELDTWARSDASSLVRLHMDPEGNAPAVSSSRMLAGMPAASIDAFVEAAGPGARTSLAIAELRQLGGALARPVEGNGVLSHLEGDFVSFALGFAPTPELFASGEEDADRFTAALAPYENGRNYANFSERSIDTSTVYDWDVVERLQQVRKAVDPSGVLQANHPLPTATNT